MIFLPPLIFSFFIGFLFWCSLLKQTSIPHRHLLILIMSAPTGLGICSLLTFWGYVIYGQRGNSISMILGYLVAGSLLISVLAMKDFDLFRAPKFFRRQSLSFSFRLNDIWPITFSKTESILKKPLTLIALILSIYIFYHIAQIFLSLIVWNAPGGWDAKFFWHVKAKFYFRSPGEWLGMFSPLITWTHPDYPLLVPGAIAWGWNWVGKEILIWPHAVSLIYYFATVLITFWFLYAYSPSWVALLAGSFVMAIEFFSYWTAELYADIPLCFFMTAAACLLICGLRTQEKKILFLSGFLAGLAAWTKNEGLLFLFWIGLFLIAGLIRKHGLSMKEKIRACVYFAGGLAIPLSAFFCQKWFYAPHGDYWGSGRSIQQYLNALFGDRTKTDYILKGFRLYLFKEKQWYFLWYFFCAAILYRAIFLRKNRGYPYGWFSGTLVGALLFGYFIIMHITPYDVRFQIETALMRLILHTSAIAVIFIFESFGSGLQRNT